VPLDTLAAWHAFRAKYGPGGLDEILAEDVVFHSPKGAMSNQLG
jgi:hypothetical protein